jgi:hypothetical protein
MAEPVQVLPPGARTMTAEVAALLRAPFPDEVMGKLPRIYCGGCRDSRGKKCDSHRKVKCSGCRNNITEAHLHLDYVGHAEATDRLLQVDPMWSWEPLAFDANGLPLLDGNGGLWIRLTVAGVTRLGYGHADGKKGPDAVKETIGDAIRNAAMRFGVALDLWGATFKGEDEPAADARPEPRPASPRPDPKAVRDWALDPDRTAQDLRGVLQRLGDGEHPDVLTDVVVNETGDEEQLRVLLQRRMHDCADAEPADPTPEPETVTQDQHKHMHALWRELGYAGDTNRDNRLAVTAKLIGRELASSKDLTHADAAIVIDALKARVQQQKRAST